MVALMKQAMASPAIDPSRRMRPSMPRSWPRRPTRSPQEALGLDEFETLSREKAYLASAFGVPVEIRSADDAGEDPKGKSRQAELGRPAIYIE